MTIDPPSDESGSFQDPLENYEPRAYADPIEQALAEQKVTALPNTPLTTIAPDLPVQDAVQLLLRVEIPCLIVVDEEGKLAGVFSRRDVLDRVASDYASAAGRPVREFMTTEPVSVFHSDAAAAAVCVMAVSGYRHAPIVEPDGTVIGMASPRAVLDFIVKVAGAEENACPDDSARG